MACGGSGSESNDAGTGTGTGTGTDHLPIIDVPASLISTADSSRTLTAVQNGLNPYQELINDTLSCFPDNVFSFATAPTYVIAIDGINFTIEDDQNTGVQDGSVVVDNNDASLTGGPLNNIEVDISFNDHGQYFTFELDNDNFHCFQNGSSVENARHTILLNTPEEAIYACEDISTGEVVDFITTDGAGITYTINDELGLYFVDEKFDSSPLCQASCPPLE